MIRRITFFLLTNILVVATISILLSVLGANRYLTASGLDIPKLAVFCFVYGMGGSFIALQLSRFSAKMMARVKVISPQDPGEYRWLVEKVHYLARRADLPKMPEVGVYPSGEVNAFATGPSKRRSLVAVSEGLLATMNDSEIEGVLAHEVAHIQNGDMVTMTLIQGVVNAFALFLSRALAFVISQAISQSSRSNDREEGVSYGLYGILAFVFDLVFTFLGMMVVAWFSRQREFRADAGSAKLSGAKDKMISALDRLGRLHGMIPAQAGPESFNTLKISSSRKGGIGHLFASHPPIAERIRNLQEARLA